MREDKYCKFKESLKNDFYSCLYNKGLNKKDIDIAFKLCKEVFIEYSSNKYESVFCIDNFNSEYSFKLFRIPLFEIDIDECIPDLSQVYRHIENCKGKVYCFDLLGFYLNVQQNFNTYESSYTALLNREVTHI